MARLRKHQVFKALRLAVLVLSSPIINVNGQEIPLANKSPIPVEIMFGNEEIYYLTILNLPFEKNSRFGYFGVGSALVPYENGRGNNEIVISNALTYRFVPKMYATTGLQIHYAKGAVPFAGLQFFSANPTWLVLFNPVFQIAPTINFETVGVIEYKPMLLKSLRLYTRLQGIYNQNLDDGIHERSLLYLRIGVSVGKTSFGIGLNNDFYGANKRSEHNHGIFINHLF